MTLKAGRTLQGEATPPTPPLAAGGAGSLGILSGLAGAIGAGVKQERLAPPPGANTKVTLASLTGSGVVKNIYLASNCGGLTADGRLQVTVDGETTPCIDVELGTLFGVFYQASRPAFGGYDPTAPIGTGITATTQHWGSYLSGNTSPDILHGGWLRLPMPFTNGIKVEIFRLAGIDTGNGVDQPSPTRQLYSSVQYSRETPPAVRLRAAANTYKTSPDGLGLKLPRAADVDVFTLTPGKPGWLVFHAFCGLPWVLPSSGPAITPGNAESWIERNARFYVDGEASPSWEWSGTEEFCNVGWGFDHADRSSSPVSGITLANRHDGLVTDFASGTHGHVNAVVDLLASCGGIRFTTSLRMQLGADTNDAVDALMTTASLYYLTV